MFAYCIMNEHDEMSDSIIDSSVKSGSGRLLLPDLLKGLAVLLMIQVHLMELFALPEIYNSNWGKISLFLGGPPAAPVFMAVMGYFLAISGAGTVSAIGRGLKLILYGLLLNIGLNLHLLYHIIIGESSLNPLSYIFGVDILFLAGLSVITIVLFRKIFNNTLIWWLMAMILVVTASTFIPYGNSEEQWSTYLLAFFYRASWWSYFPLIPWLAYPVAGYTFRLIEIRLPNRLVSSKNSILAGLILVGILLATFSYGFGISSDLQAYYHHNLFYFLWALIFLMVWMALLRLLLKITGTNPVTGFLQWIGRNVTAFYVFQWLIIGNLATAFYKSVSAIQLLFWFAGISILTSFLVWMYRIALTKYRNRKDTAMR
jgi:uncharacterized membrane protein